MEIIEDLILEKVEDYIDMDDINCTYETHNTKLDIVIDYNEDIDLSKILGEK